LNFVSFPFHKFFNIDEHDETGLQEVAGWQYRSITEKVDGVMIQVFRHGGEVVFASRHGIGTRASQLAAALAVRHSYSYPLADRFRHTLICELIHPEVWQPGMISYSPGLTAAGPIVHPEPGDAGVDTRQELLASSNLSASYSLTAGLPLRQHTPSR
jgi:hypothetical protein